MAGHETAVALLYGICVTIVAFFAHSLRSKADLLELEGSGMNSLNVFTNPIIFIILLKNMLYYSLPLFVVLGFALASSITKAASGSADTVTLLDLGYTISMVLMITIYTVTALQLLKEFVVYVRDIALKKRLGYNPNDE